MGAKVAVDADEGAAVGLDVGAGVGLDVGTAVGADVGTCQIKLLDARIEKLLPFSVFIKRVKISTPFFSPFSLAR